jgi:flagellin
MIISHNLSAINTQRNLTMNARGLSKSLEKLSSGYRVNVASDGPADLIISEQLRAQTAGLQRAVKNTQEAMNVLGIAEGALNEMNEILKKMRALALHAANSGITSPIQIAADQSETDSALQTLDRIANTTKYSDQFLLNGNKDIVYSTTSTGGTNRLLEGSRTHIDQVFRTNDYAVNISYSGGEGTQDSAFITTQAQRAYLEAGATTASKAEFDSSGGLTANQVFTITGKNGSRQFNFAKGTNLSDIASAIDSVSDATGVKAQLVFGSEGATTRTNATNSISRESDGTGGDDRYAAGDAISDSQVIVMGWSSFNSGSYIISAEFTSNVVVGKNTDGQGRIYMELADDGSTLNLYKSERDESGNFDATDMVATATWNAGATYFTEVNDSGLSMYMSLNGAFPVADLAQLDDVVLIAETTDYQSGSSEEACLTAAFGARAVIDFTARAAYTGSAGNDISVKFSTDEINTTGNVVVEVNGTDIIYHLKTDANGNAITTTAGEVLAAHAGSAADALVSAVNGSLLASSADAVETMGKTYLTGGMEAYSGWTLSAHKDDVSSIAVSGAVLGDNTDENGNLYFDFDIEGGAALNTIYVYSDASKSADSLVAVYDGGTNPLTQRLRAGQTYFCDEANDSGLRVALSLSGAGLTGATPTSFTMTADMGLRLYSEDYGENAQIKMEATQGNLWDYYSGDPEQRWAGYKNIAGGSEDSAVTVSGQNAQVSINGHVYETDGLELNVATSDLAARLMFDEGELGRTGVAQTGYDIGATTTAIGQFFNVNNFAVNAGFVSTEKLDELVGGMQLQLGEGAGDQERTTVALQSMAIANLGHVKFKDDFDADGTEETKMLSLQDMLGGGYASLATDPVKALDIIDQAISDVSTMRARIGALQSNMLQTNANSLAVAIENIAKTESAIRDADMASETTEFTKNQVLINASTSMLAQANAQSQNVLKLLNM